MTTIDDIGRLAADDLRADIEQKLDPRAALSRLAAPVEGGTAAPRRGRLRMATVLTAAAAVIVATVVIAVRHRDAKDHIITPVTTTTTTTSPTTTGAPALPTSGSSPPLTASAAPSSPLATTSLVVPESVLPRLLLGVAGTQPQGGHTSVSSPAEQAGRLPEWRQLFVRSGHPAADGAIQVTLTAATPDPSSLERTQSHGSWTWIPVRRPAVFADVRGWRIPRAELQRLADSIKPSTSAEPLAVGYVPPGYVALAPPASVEGDIVAQSSLSYLVSGENIQLDVERSDAEITEGMQQVLDVTAQEWSAGTLIVRGHPVLSTDGPNGDSKTDRVVTLRWREAPGVSIEIRAFGSLHSAAVAQLADTLRPATPDEWAAVMQSGSCRVELSLDDVVVTGETARASITVHNRGDACAYPALIELADKSDAPVIVVTRSNGGIALAARTDQVLHLTWPVSGAERPTTCLDVGTLIVVDQNLMLPTLRLPFDSTTLRGVAAPCGRVTLTT